MDTQKYELSEELMRNARDVLRWVRALRRNRNVAEAYKLAVFDKALAESGAKLEKAFDEGYGLWGEPLLKARQPIWNVVAAFSKALVALSSPREEYESEYVLFELGRCSEIANCCSDDESDEFSIQVKNAINQLRTLLDS